MSDEELSGRYVRVPVEFVERRLHPWMEASSWRDSYIRLQRNRSFTRHKREINGRTYWLNEGQLLISVGWLRETCPDLSEKSARLFLKALEDHGLITYPGGKKAGAWMQTGQLTEAWVPTKTTIRKEREARREARARSKAESGRGERSRKRKKDPELQDQTPAEGRGETADQGEVDGFGARSTHSEGGVGLMIDPENPDQGEVTRPENGSGTRVSGWQHVGRGEVTGGGDNRGGGQAGDVRREPPSVSPPGGGREKPMPRALQDELVKFAAAYCAPDRDGVLPLKGRELKDLRVLVTDVWAGGGQQADAVREFFVRARRWADSKEIERMNATFVRSNHPAIKEFTALTLQEERNRAAMLRKREQEDRSYEEQARYAKWQARLFKEFHALDVEEQTRRLEEAQDELPEPPDDPLARRAFMLAVKTAALERLGAETGDPKP